jgi:outer membrane protein, heavy metal efflux system
MHVPRLRALLFGAVLALPWPALAAPAPNSLHDLVELAWLRSPAARGMLAREGETDAARSLAGAWSAGQPVLGLSQRSGRWNDQNGARESEISVSAPFWTPGQRSARRDLAASSAAEVQAQLRKTRLDVAGEVRSRLWDAAQAQALQEEKEGHLHHNEDLAEEVARRVAAGELARVDALLANQEVLAARIAVEQAKSEAHASLSRLRVLTGPTGALPLQPEPLAPAAASDNPQLLAARASEQRAQAALRLAQASRSAPPTLSLSVRQERDPLQTQRERSLGVAVQVPIGSAGRNRQVEAQVQTQIAVAAAEAAQAEDATHAEREVAQLQIGHAQVALAASAARVSAMQEHEQLIQKAFRLGERGLADLLRSRALAHEAQVAHRQQEVALGRAHARFNQASGVLP